MTADGAVTIRLDPLFTQGCSKVAGDSTTFTGTTPGDETIFIETSATVTCLNYTEQQEDGTRTLTFNLWRPRS
jgi:hypothetical protein